MNYSKIFGLAISTALFVAFILISSSSTSAQTISSNYTSHLIDDPVMRDYSSMTAYQIQAFLQTEGSGLATFSDIENCGSTSGPNYAFYASYYSCGSSASAAQIIYSASQAYGINPQVILATMQKEQSLVTTPDPTASQLDYAMGYGCPDSGGCSYPGFFNQVDNATWQFRADMDLSSGNTYWGYSPSDYVCNSATRYYSAPLVAGNNVTFYDDSGNAYAQFILPNASTATLYCYTPHVYPGSSTEYYSGSYWFVYYFNIWFGSTYADAYSATPVAQSPYPSEYAGQSSTVYIKYENTGNSSWYDDDSVPAGTDPVHLAATNPINRNSVFSYGWPSAGRPDTTFSAVYEPDGVTLSGNQHVVEPGQIAEFQFNLTAPWTIAPGTYSEYFQPVLEGATGWNMGGVAWINVTVNPTYSAQLYSQSAYPTMTLNTYTPVSLDYLNTGTAPWYDDNSAPSGTDPVHLATANPINRWSGFGATWPSRERPGLNFSEVYNSDGTTLASNQNVVEPGQIAEFDFDLTAQPGAVNPGTYSEYFQPILEGSPVWNMGGLAWLNINVQPDPSSAQFVSQSPYVNESPGQSTTVYIEYKNNGTNNWYDDVSAPSGILPVHLAATNPINRNSVFSYGWPSAGRPDTTFSAVYEPDGVTLSGNQHVVEPGQIAEFQFNLTAPWTIAPGTYSEYFQPVLEGATGWNMGGVAWINVTVN